ncbi:hypothetical protein VFPFJ_09651 [Purpureocillium lilacinum]|uniref:Uncharacterized protein n=1 Tax=Purpureocillium lilacinum TaxID=33203 RepID=A0A179GDL0_PURLI|nr:hypothetical protein VFPFJ_09651 [Purpureocillium lilacinum]OAQ75570.1 hypothetical protein VFPBJ_09543 [Purpureocillium lilacinum]OAQ81196.1 hypothetical protein VFPFJ_09651 [Purpureocillium lilacinum]
MAFVFSASSPSVRLASADLGGGCFLFRDVDDANPRTCSPPHTRARALAVHPVQDEYRYLGLDRVATFTVGADDKSGALCGLLKRPAAALVGAPDRIGPQCSSAQSAPPTRQERLSA